MSGRERMPTAEAGKPRRRRVADFGVALGLVAIHLAFGVWAARETGVTTDEMAHVASGIFFWQQRDLRLDPSHPPLARLWLSWPLATKDLKPFAPEGIKKLPSGNWACSNCLEIGLMSATFSTPMSVANWSIPASERSSVRA